MQSRSVRSEPFRVSTSPALARPRCFEAGEGTLRPQQGVVSGNTLARLSRRQRHSRGSERLLLSFRNMKQDGGLGAALMTAALTALAAPARARVTGTG